MLGYITDTEEDETDNAVGLAPHSIAWLEECLSARLADPEDEGGPEDVMTNLGYVQLWRDGEIVFGGLVIYKLKGGE
jgi:hypothetical protein